MDKKYYDNLSASPHLVTAMDTQKTMLMVLIALVPSLLVSTYVFGFRVLILTAVCIAASMFFEWAWNKLMKRKQTVCDLSAALTGTLIAFNLPSGVPYWIAIVGCFVAIIVVKQLFGGIGKNLVNPAITARIVLFISFATEMTTWPLPRMNQTADVLTGPTPLGVIHEGGQLPTNMEMFLGYIGGSMGEVSAIALIIGGLFLVWKKIISPIIPCCFIGTVFVFALIYYSATGNGCSPDGSLPYPCRRRNAWCDFHGYRLCNFSVITCRKSCIRYRMRRYHNAYQTVRSVSGRRILLHPDYELPDTAHRQLLPEENVWRC